MKRLFTLCTLMLTLMLTVCAQVTPTVENASEISYFLEAPEGTYYVWPYDNSGNGGGEYTKAEWPGATMTDKGTLSNGRHLYKWTCLVNIGTPTNVIISKDSNTKLIETAASNHTYFLSTNGTSATASYVVGTQAPGDSYSKYGHRVIYELNVGSFTSQGTFNAAKDRLDYLKDLGIDVIWLMPIYPRGGGINSPYAATDFTTTNSSYGSVSDLKSFVDAAHAKNMDVILDWVPNHVATNNVWAASHPEYINKNADGSFKHPNNYGDVIELNYNTVGDVMTGILKDWIDKAGVDGFRFDYISSPTIPDSYFQKMARELRTKKPNVILLGEGDLGAASVTKSSFDYDYAWGFNDDMRRFGLGSTNFSTFKDKVQNYLKNLNGFDISRMLYLSNHDNNWNGDGVTDKKSMKDVFGNHRYTMTVMEFTLPGMPLVYNGQELNGTMELNYFSDTKINWNATDANMTNLIKALAKMKHDYDALGDGNSPSLRGETNFKTASGSNVMAYERVQGNDRVLVVMNFSGSAVNNCTISGLQSGKWHQVLAGSPSSVNTTPGAAQNITSLTVNLPANGYCIYKYGDSVDPDPIDPDPVNPTMYFVTEDSWSNPTAHQMTKISEGTYTYTIARDEFDGYQEKTNEKAKVYVKLPSEYTSAALYAWKEGIGDVKDPWPGIHGEKNGEYFEFDLPDDYYSEGCNFIVNNNNGGKQVDIDITDDLLDGITTELYVEVIDFDKEKYTVRKESSNPLYFKFSNGGSNNFYGAGDNVTDTYFGYSGKEIAYTSTASDGGAAFNMQKPSADIDVVVITLKVGNSVNQGTVKVEFKSTPLLLRQSVDASTNISSLNAVTKDNVKVVLERDFWAGNWNPVLLPFDVTREQLKAVFGNDVQVAEPYTASSGTNTNISFKITTGNLTKGMPYLVKSSSLNATSEAGRYDFGMHNKNLISLNTSNRTVGDVQLKGAYGTQTAPAGAYCFASDGKLYHITKDTSVGGFRFYMTNATSSAKQITFSIWDETTGIAERVTTANEQKTAIFNLAGQRVSAASKGIVIINGKKMVIR